MHRYATDMRIAGYSPVTITDRLELLQRFRDTLPHADMLAVTPDEIRAFQEAHAHLSPASTNIYARHLKAFFDWAARQRLVDPFLPDNIVIPRAPKGRPHPTKIEDLRLIMSCARGSLRVAYALAAFAGLRRGEICRLTRQDIDLSGELSTALIHGKGGKERTVPFLAPVVDELESYGMPRAGAIVRRDGKPYDPARMSTDSTVFLQGIGVVTTLHSMRGTFATQAARMTRDPMLVRDLLGHGSVSTTEIYMETSLQDAHQRLAGVTELAVGVLGNERPALRAVGG